MDISAILRDLIARWPSVIFIGIRVLFIAIVFEFLAWWIGRRLENLASPFISLDGGREASWRATRRATLRQAPKIVLRSLLYTIALILVFEAFGLQILPLSLGLGAVALLFGAALLPMMRDYAQGYILLSEDVLAPGDVVEIGGHAGQVEKWTLRATWLRDSSGALHILPNREVREVVVHRRATEAKTANSGAFDPLAAGKPTRTLPQKK
ncbi:MAG: mechanosensitive ion channel family protein [Armatimonadetes bacterium]|nr:mechanosensitive ion channel family protein [Armatimonadota bacterium]